MHTDPILLDDFDAATLLRLPRCRLVRLAALACAPHYLARRGNSIPTR